MYEHLISPSKGWYFLAGAVFVVGMTIFTLFLISNLFGLGDELTQIVVPGSSEIDLPESGVYTIFYEYVSVVGSELYSTDANLSGLQIAVETSDRVPVSVRKPSSSSTYSLPGREAFAVLEFFVVSPGRYRLSAAYASGAQEPRVVLAVGHEFLSGLLGVILGSFAIGGATVGISAVIFIFTLLKRRKSKERLAIMLSKQPKPRT